MEMRIAAVAALICLAPITQAAAGETTPTFEMSADGELQIATDGHVSDYRLQSELPQLVADLVDKNVRAWSFEPVLVDGAPVVARTAMRLSLHAEPAGDKDKYRIRIANVQFGAPRQHDNTHPPRYPEEAVHAGVGARVLLAVRLDADGTVSDVQPYQTNLDVRPRSEFEAERWRRQFEHASVAAARFWRYDLSETVNGKPIGTSVIVPVVFSLRGLPGSMPKDGAWKAYLPGPVHPAPWMTERSIADNHDMSALPPDQALSLDSRFHLKDDVIGKAL